MDDGEPPNFRRQFCNRPSSGVFRAKCDGGKRSLGESCFRRIGRIIGILANNNREASRYYLVCYGGSFLWMLFDGDLK
jgi:hypothetical protein